MSNDDILDLSEIDPAIWHVMVNEVGYGPYTLGQMRGFILEGQLSIKSKIAEGDGAPFLPAGEQPALMELFQALFASKSAKTDSEPANYIVVAKSISDSRNRIISILNTLGHFTEIMPGVFLINTRTRTAKIRELLDETCDETDRIMIVNADTGRLAWIGLGPEVDSQIRSVWKSKKKP